MLANAPITTILPVTDMSRATAFYRDTLGLQDAGEAPDGSHAFRTTAGGSVQLLPAEAGAQTKHTVLTFEVTDMPAEIADLESRNVAFLDYDEPGLRTVDHVATLGDHRAAWFADTEGNVLCLHEKTAR
ncbi:VOC family protein [Phytoactinopolyspora halotolerans]|uniref:VOC family protein n=1 Tax=Phytoactinopolyspora halotolerans TaxID=1981512 RepID=A0A6L9SCL9_9ACTN|nr:VOC family protein [Phytoactinopolyspora halotolerans]NEE02813.1 VOC family protein [Phytoactinopolyspora halotolerans]